MKKIALILVLTFSFQIVNSQEKKDISDTKKEKAEIQKQYQSMKEMIESKNFVLEAEFLQDNYGNREMVSSNINFIKVDSSTAVIQIGLNNRIGPNGVGGVTAEGKITNWELQENDRKKDFYLKVTVLTGIGAYDLQFSIRHNGKAIANLSGMRPGRLTFEGNLLSLEESSLFEGISL